MRKINVRYRGHIKQIPIYVGKFFRMFIYLSDWKVLPMSAVIAGIVAFVCGASMFQTMEGTAMGAMALTCVCLWNGCFNSIQVVCRERGIVKREHRAGMHIASYIFAHMIYQSFLCLLQSGITLAVLAFTTVHFPVQGFITPWCLLDFLITLFLITFAADMMSLMLSCIVKNTTSAMTVMPLVLIIQLVFSGILFSSGNAVATFSRYTIAKWGMVAICALSNYNSQPMVAVWNQLFRYRYYTVDGVQPIDLLLRHIEQNNQIDAFCAEVGAASYSEEYATSIGNIFASWGILIGFALLFAFLAMVFLKQVDKDRR